MPEESCSCCKALWVKFYLTHKLTTTGADAPSATAKVFVDSGSVRHFWQGEDPAPGDAEFTVYNLEDRNGVAGVYRFSGEIDDVGLACLDDSLPDTDRYRIVTLSQRPPLVIRFKLTASLSTGGSAAAVIRTFDGTTYNDGSAIVVFDWYSLTTQVPGSARGMWQGVSGMEGFALKRETPSVAGQEQYDIIWMEQYARYVQFTLLEDLGKTTAGQAQASRNFAFGQGDDITTITVHDDQGMFPHALEEAKGVAIRNEYQGSATTPWYTIVNCQQMVIYGTAKLAMAMCDYGEVAIYDFVGRSFSVFNQNPDPLPIVAQNEFGHKGMPGYKLWLMWKEFTAQEKADRAEQQLPDKDGEWVIIDVEKIEEQVVTDVYYVNGCFYKTKIKIAVERCDASFTETITCAVDCP